MKLLSAPMDDGLLLRDLALPAEGIGPAASHRRDAAEPSRNHDYGRHRRNVVDAIRARARTSSRRRGKTRSGSPTFARRLPGPCRRRVVQLTHPSAALKQRYNFENIVGKSEPMLRLLRHHRPGCSSRATCSFRARANGKERISKAIHATRLQGPGLFPSKPARAIGTDSESDALRPPQRRLHIGSPRKKALRRANGGTLFLMRWYDVHGLREDHASLKDVRLIPWRVQEIQVEVSIIAATKVTCRRPYARAASAKTSSIAERHSGNAALRSAGKDIHLLPLTSSSFTRRRMAPKIACSLPEAMRIIRTTVARQCARAPRNAMERGVVLYIRRSIRRISADTIEGDLLGIASRPPAKCSSRSNGRD